jgi:hypothetical protein
MKRNTKLLVTGLTLAMLTAAQGCSTAGKTTKGQDAVPTGMSSLSGKVVETMDAGGYTYILLDKDGKKTWAAAPVTKVAVGQQLNLQPGGELTNFSSKALNRTFDKIIFSSGVVEDGSAKPVAAKSSTSPTATTNSAPVLEGKVVETMNTGGYTYILLEKDGKRGWAAVPTAEVKVGQEIALIPGIDMGKFTSATMKRTFDNIHFSGGIKSKTGGETPKETLPEGHPPMKPSDPSSAAPAAAPAAPAAPAASAPSFDTISGKVVETMDAAGYTYAAVEKDGQKVWVAVPTTKISVGEEVAFQPGAVMPKFTSKTLNRTFDKIIFSNGKAK